MLSPPNELLGETIARKYRIERLLGRGGMGAVYLAEHLDGEFQVALKLLLHADFEGADRRKRRFMREARLAAKIRHPNVVNVLDFGRWGADRDRYYLSMEYVDGVTLAEVIDGPIALSGVLALINDVVEALAHVHARGILHRDIKPENILVVRGTDGSLTARVTDFGIAAAQHETDQRITVDGATLGTPGYMSPEQALGQSMAGPTMDLYAVGGLIYRACTGRLPFQGSVTAVLVDKAMNDARWPDDCDSAVVPDAVRDIAMKLLARDPNDRPSCAADIVWDLRPHVARPIVSDEQWRHLRPTDNRPIELAETRSSSDFRAQLSDTAGTPASKPGLAFDDLESSSTDSADRAVVNSRLWGRQQIMDRIVVVAGHVERGEGHAVVVDGDTGLGKSETIHEAAAALAESGRFSRLDVQFHSTDPTGGLRMALDGLFGTVGRGAGTVRDAAEGFLASHGDADPDEVEQLVGFLRPSAQPQANESWGQTAALLMRMLRRLAKTKPVVLTLDDMEAGGSHAAALLEHILFESSFEPACVLVLATHCPRSGSDRFRKLLARSARFEGKTLWPVTLHPLERDEMVAGLRAEFGLGRAAARRVYERSGGNPLFARQLAMASTDSGERLVFASSTSVTGTHSSGELPTALSGIVLRTVEEQLGRLDDADRARALLVEAALLGSAVRIQVLESYTQAPDHFDDDLDALIDVGLLVESREVDGDYVQFPQAVVREVLLAGISSRRARRYNRRAAEVRIELAGASACSESGPIGDHHEGAGDLDEAIQCWSQAMDWELRKGDALRAAQYGWKVAAAREQGTCCGADSRAERMSIRVARILGEAGEFDDALRLMIPLVDHVDTDLALVAADTLAEMYENLGDSHDWKAVIDKMADRVGDAGPEGLRAFNRSMSFWDNTAGRAASAVEYAHKALDGAEPGFELQRAHQRLAICLGVTGNMAESRRHAQLALDASGDATHLRLRSLRVVGLIGCWSGDEQTAMQAHTEAADIARQTGHAARLALALSDLADTLIAFGEFDKAGALLDDAARAASAIGMQWVIDTVRFNRIQLALVLGDRDVVQDIDELLADAGQRGHVLLKLGGPLLRLWALAASGRHTEIQVGAGIGHAISTFPKMRISGVLAEGTATALMVDLKSHTELSELTERLLIYASGCWQQLHNEHRLSGVADKLAIVRGLRGAS